MDIDSAKTMITDFVLREFLPGETAENLTPDVRLISEGIIDSMASLKLVAFLEEEFGVEFPAHFIDADHLENVDLIAEAVAASPKAR